MGYLGGVREHGREHRRLKSTTFNYADSRSSGYPQGHFYIRFSHISQLSYRWVTKTLWVFRRNLIFLSNILSRQKKKELTLQFFRSSYNNNPYEKNSTIFDCHAYGHSIICSEERRYVCFRLFLSRLFSSA